MPFEIPKLGDLMLGEMAASWVSGEIFSELHIEPYKRELAMAIFPSAKEAMESESVAKVVREECGFIFGLMAARFKDRSLRVHLPGTLARVYPIFPDCLFLHKDQREPLQRLIDKERLARKWRIKQGRSMPGPRIA